MIELLGLLPSNTLDLMSASVALDPSSYPQDESPKQQSLISDNRTHLTNGLLSLSKCQSLGLGKKVGEEDTMVSRAGAGLGERVVRCGGGDKVGGDDFGALVHELVERVLAVGSGRTPDDGLQRIYNVSPTDM
jgi:hypothetical protein